VHHEGGASIKADLIGPAVLAGEVGLLGIVVSSLGIPFWGWIVAYAFLGSIAIGLWHSDKWPNKLRDVLLAVPSTLLLGGLFFACDLILGHLHHPDLSLVKAAEQSGGPLGFGSTLLVCPVTTLVVLLGYFRAVFLEEMAQKA
jgi:hypothetical protein